MALGIKKGALSSGLSNLYGALNDATDKAAAAKRRAPSAPSSGKVNASNAAIRPVFDAGASAAQGGYASRVPEYDSYRRKDPDPVEDYLKNLTTGNNLESTRMNDEARGRHRAGIGTAFASTRGRANPYAARQARSAAAEADRFGLYEQGKAEEQEMKMASDLLGEHRVQKAEIEGQLMNQELELYTALQDAGFADAALMASKIGQDLSHDELMSELSMSGADIEMQKSISAMATNIAAARARRQDLLNNIDRALNIGTKVATSVAGLV